MCQPRMSVSTHSVYMCAWWAAGGGGAAANTRGYLICIPSEPGGGPSLLCGNIQGAFSPPPPHRKHKRRGTIWALQPELRESCKTSQLQPRDVWRGEGAAEPSDTHKANKTPGCRMKTYKGSPSTGVLSEKTRQAGRAPTERWTMMLGGQFSTSIYHFIHRGDVWIILSTQESNIPSY